MQEYFDGLETIQVEEFTNLHSLTDETYTNLAIGESEDFIESLNKFNFELERVGAPTVDVTAKWNWKAGSYDNVKDYLFNRLDLHKKSRNIANLIERTKDRTNYLSYILRMAQYMERLRADLRQSGVTKDIDINKFKEDCNEFIHNTLYQCDKVATTTNGKVIILPYAHMVSNGKDATLYLDILLRELNLDVYDGQGTIKLQSIPLNDIHIICKANLRKVLNKSCRSNGFNWKGKYLSEVGMDLRFPYINSIGSQNYSRRTYDSVCLDKHHDSVGNALSKNNLLTVSMHLMNWAQYYNIKFANPYNQPYESHIGMPKDYSKAYVLSSVQDSGSRKCYHKLTDYFEKSKKFKFLELSDNIFNKCEDIECQWRDACNGYQIIKRRNDIIDSEYGYQAESMIELIIDDIRDRACKSVKYDGQIIKSAIGDLLGYEIIFTSECWNDEGIVIDKALDLFRQRYYWYLINKKRFDSYLYNYLRANDLIDEPSKSIDETAELMKQWANG